MVLWGLVTWQGAQALDEDPFFKKRSFDLPVREQAVIITDEGFYPQNIVIFKGEKVRFFVTNTSDQKSCFILKGKDFFLAAEKGKVSEGVFHFKDKGRVEFYCPSQKNKGHLTVLEKPKKGSREIASEKTSVRVWMPREE